MILKRNKREFRKMRIFNQKLAYSFGNCFEIQDYGKSKPFSRDFPRN